MTRHHEELAEYNDTMREVQELRADNEQLRAAAEDALATLEAIELLDARRFGLKTEAVTASCDKLHRALENKP